MVGIILGTLGILLIGTIIFCNYLDKKEEKELKTLEEMPESPCTLTARNFKVYYEIPEYKIKGKLKGAFPGDLRYQTAPEIKVLHAYSQDSLNFYKRQIKTSKDLLEHKKQEIKNLDDEIRKWRGDFD